MRYCRFKQISLPQCNCYRFADSSSGGKWKWHKLLTVFYVNWALKILVSAGNDSSSQKRNQRSSISRSDSLPRGVIISIVRLQACGHKVIHIRIHTDGHVQTMQMFPWHLLYIFQHRKDFWLVWKRLAVFWYYYCIPQSTVVSNSGKYIACSQIKRKYYI